MPRETVSFPPQISKLLESFRDRLKAILDEKFVALYVFGSLGMGDFSEHQSDIDFLVLIANPLGDVEGKRLQALHKELSETRFGDKLEGEYVVVSTLHAEGVTGTVARCEGGILQLDVQSQISAENVLDVRQNAYVVYGPNPENVLPEVPRESLNKVMRDYLEELNDEMKNVESKSLTWLSSRALDISRTLYTLKTGNITSKSAGAKWALKALSPEWKPLIRRSLAIRHGNSKENDRTLLVKALPHFAKYALSCHTIRQDKKFKRPRER